MIPFKDKELQQALDDLAKSVSLVRIASIDSDPWAYTTMLKRMGELNVILVRKLLERQCASSVSPIPTDNTES